MIAASAFQNIVPDWWIVVPIFFASSGDDDPGRDAFCPDSVVSGRLS